MSINEPEPIAGWAGERRPLDNGRVTGAEAVVRALEHMGIRRAFGIVGGGIAPFADAIARSRLSLIHTRHEAGAAFGAVEAYFATNTPTCVFVTTGPGLTNALTGLLAARWDGAKLVVVSGVTSAARRGRWGVQESSAHTPMADWYGPSQVFDLAVVLSALEELPQLARRIELGFARANGFVAHVGFPLDCQSAPTETQPWASSAAHAPAPRSEDVELVLRLLTDEPTPIWLGFGARHAAEDIVRLAEATGAPVMCSPRAKGTFPEGHPLYLGVTGVGGHESVQRHIEQTRPRHVLVLGTRLGEVTSCWDSRYLPTEALVHVDVDPAAFGASYPAARTIGVQANVGELVRALLARLEDRGGRSKPPVRALAPLETLSARSGPVRPQFLMQAIQRVIVDATDAPVMTESGNAFGWGNRLLRFETPLRYRTSAGFGAMGHFTTGVVGAAIARDGKAVAIVGDGAMLMNDELSTAVQYGAKAVWIVLNDGLYGITHQAMTAQGFAPVETSLPPTQFVMRAEAVGATGTRVTSEHELMAALAEAMEREGPFVVDVEVDRRETNPVVSGRVRSLEAQRKSNQEQAP